MKDRYSGWRSCDLRYTPHSQRVPDSTRLAEKPYLLALPTYSVRCWPDLGFSEPSTTNPPIGEGGGSIDQGIAGLSHSTPATGGLVPTIRVTTIGKSIGGYGGN